MTCTGKDCAEYEKPLREVTIWFRPWKVREFGSTNQVQRHHLCSECIAQLADDPEVEAFMVHPRGVA